MANFKMECDRCGQPIEVKTGLFVSKKKYFTCECGYSTRVIRNVEEKCPVCGDYFVYDRSKENSPICPHCHHALDREARFKKAIEAAKEREKEGFETSPFLTMASTESFNKNS